MYKDARSLERCLSLESSSKLTQTGTGIVGFTTLSFVKPKTLVFVGGSDVFHDAYGAVVKFDPLNSWQFSS